MWARRLLGKDQLLGTRHISLAELTENQTLHNWDNLIGGSGSLRAEITYSVETVRSEEEYRDLKSLLLERDLGTVLVLAEAPSANLANLAYDTLRIWRVSARTLEGGRRRERCGDICR